ncbi:hypothetical protein [Shewanella frigidimarina]|uniref:hypothetical protein n=1 Tax=Shewanella frigidimarina TaxID=56812 RepID=UPI003D7B28AC
MNYKTIQQAIGKCVHYYCDGLFKFNENGFSTVKHAKAIIIARHHYLERTIDLPIAIKKDIKAAVELEIEHLSADFHVLYKITDLTNGKSRVVVWQIPKKIIPKGVLIVIPETYVLSAGLAKNTILRYQNLTKRPVLLANTLTDIVSSTSVAHTVPIFAHAFGINGIEVEELALELLPERLLKGVMNRNLELLSGFYCKTKVTQRDWKTYLQPLLLPLVTCSVLYLLLSTLFVSLQHSSVVAKIESQSESINSVLQLQGEIAQQSEQLAQFEKHHQQQKTLLPAWEVFAPLYDNDVKFQFIRYDSNEIIFSAEASSASQVLEMLLDNPLVASAAFTTAIRKTGNKESFIIKFSLAPYTVTTENKSPDTLNAEEGKV